MLSYGHPRAAVEADPVHPAQIPPGGPSPVRPRVLHLIPSLSPAGGAENSLTSMAPRLVARGVDLTIGYLHERAPEVAARLRAQGVRVELVPGASFAARALAARRLIGDRAAQVVHASLYEADQIARVASLGLPVTVLSSVVSTPYAAEAQALSAIPRWKRELVRRWDVLSARARVDHFVANSHTAADAARAAGLVGRREVAVVYRGRDGAATVERDPARRARVCRALGIADGPLVLSVGRHVAAKGQLNLLRAWPAVLDHHPDARLLIAGASGPMTAALERERSRIETSDSVILLGHRSDVAELLAAADVFAFPSLHEGLPGAVIEAMATGTPIVGSSIGPVRELTGDAAALVPPGDVEALARELIAGLGDPAAGATRAARARGRFEAGFTLDASVAATAELYRQLAGRAGC